MTPEAVLVELLARISARPGSAVYIRSAELETWPAEVVAALQAAGLLTRANSSLRMVCPGCDRMCSKPVRVRPAIDDRPADMVIDCDEPEAMGQIYVEPLALERWQSSAELLAEALGRVLNFGRPPQRHSTDGRWILGYLKGTHRQSVVELEVGREVSLFVNGHAIGVTEIIRFDGNALAADPTELLELANRRVPNGRTEGPDDRRKRIELRIRELKKGGIKAFLQAVAKEEGVTPTRIKQILGRRQKGPTISERAKRER